MVVVVIVIVVVVVVVVVAIVVVVVVVVGVVAAGGCNSASSSPPLLGPARHAAGLALDACRQRGRVAAVSGAPCAVRSSRKDPKTFLASAVQLEKGARDASLCRERLPARLPRPKKR